MGRKVESFEDLHVWQRSRALAAAVYRLTDGPAFRRDWGLRDQLRRSAVSVMSNIAEGFERGSRPAFHQFTVVAKASCGELRSQLYVARDAGMLTDAQFRSLRDEAGQVSRMLGALRRSLAAPATQSSVPSPQS